MVMMISKHRYRYLYFGGRLLSFTLAGLAAGGAGAILNLVLTPYHLSAILSFLFGGIIILLAACTLFGWRYPGYIWLASRTSNISKNLSILMAQNHPWPTFLLGFFTIALPCGQTLTVYSACALTGDLFAGLINGFAFSFLTTPSLIVAMHAHTLFRKWSSAYKPITGSLALLVGGLALCRGFAEIGLIPHLILNPESASAYHIVIY